MSEYGKQKEINLLITVVYRPTYMFVIYLFYEWENCVETITSIIKMLEPKGKNI